VCVSVQAAQSSVQRGHDAAFGVTVSVQNGSAAGVSVALSSAPSSQKPAFTSGCAQGGNTADCAVGTVTDTKAVSLQVQIPVPASAASGSSVQLTATTSLVTTAKWIPLAADETVAVTATPASPASSSADPTPFGAEVTPGPLPDLNGVSSSLIGAGNAAGLFPAISPAATSSTNPAPSPGVRAAGAKQSAESVAYSSTLAPVLTAQVAGLIALAVALMLTVTRLSLRRRFRAPKQGS
jgi:hypothetical protein